MHQCLQKANSIANVCTYVCQWQLLGDFWGFWKLVKLCLLLLFTTKRSAMCVHWLLAVRIQGEICFYVPFSMILFAQLLKIWLRFNLWRPDFKNFFLGGHPPDPPKYCGVSSAASSWPLETFAQEPPLCHVHVELSLVGRCHGWSKWIS